jgi:acyl-CoA thioesterase
VSLEPKLLRAGRTLTHAECRLLQNGEPMAVFTGVYASARSTSLQLISPSAPETKPWNELPRLPYIEHVMPRFTQHFEYHVPPGRTLFSGQKKPQVGGYVRHLGGGPIDTAGLLALIDAWPPAFMPALARPAVASSVTWMVDIVAEIARRGTQTDAFYRYEAEPVAGHAGYASCDARLWNEAGQLVAVSRQLVAEFS